MPPKPSAPPMNGFQSPTLVFDIGMFDGSDTAYYLSLGARVVAVEADPFYAAKARKTFQDAIASGRLTIVNGAICEAGEGEVLLNRCAEDPGSSSLGTFARDGRLSPETVSVPRLSLAELIEKHGQPCFIKVDIEGSDRFCVLPLTAANRPDWISFEAGEDLFELASHLESIGFTHFKAVSQENFRDLQSQRALLPRCREKLASLLGYREPRLVRCRGRFFKSGHSSGPVPWRSHGKWRDLPSLLRDWERLTVERQAGAWFDLLATTVPKGPPPF